MNDITAQAQREKFEAWWVKGNNGCQPRSGWEALRAEDGYNDEDIDMQYEGFKAAAEIYGMQWRARAVVSEPSKPIPAGKFMFEACGQRWHHIKHGEAQYSEPRLQMVKLYQEGDVLALVEALEKAQQYAKERDEENQSLMLTVGRLRVEREHLESRTVTVKLPKRSVGEVMHMSGFSRDYAEGWCSGNDNAIHEMRAAGIQVIEGEQKNG